MQKTPTRVGKLGRLLRLDFLSVTKKVWLLEKNSNGPNRMVPQKFKR